MHSLATRLLRHAGQAAALTARRRPLPLGLAAAPCGAWRGRGYAPVTAIATPLRPALPGLGSERSGGLPGTLLEPPAPAPAAPGAPPRHMGEAWQGYLRSLERNPLATKAATSFLLCVVGDTLAQLMGGAPYSVARVLRLAAYTSCVGTSVNHYWHRWLERRMPDTSGRTVVKKTLLDQLVMSPVMLLVFFSAVKLMEGQPAAIIPYVQEKYVPTLLAGYSLWFPWNLASFRWIPEDLRILAGNLVGLGWGVYISLTCVNGSVPCPATAAAVTAIMVEAAAE